MILFFGTRAGKKVTKHLAGIRCPNCQQKGTLTSFSHKNFIHLFWIPIIPIGTSQFAECGHCKKGFYKEEFSQEMQRELQD